MDKRRAYISRQRIAVRSKVGQGSLIPADGVHGDLPEYVVEVAWIAGVKITTDDVATQREDGPYGSWIRKE